MRPDHLLSQIHPVYNASVKFKDVKINPAGTGGDNQSVYAVFRNVLFDQFNPFLATKKRMSFNRKTFFFRDFTQRFHVKGIPDPATCADIYTIFFIHG
jgi:hypothetical protein